MLYLFNYLFFWQYLFSVMSCKLLFIFDRPIICRTVKYIGHSDKSSWLKRVLYHIHVYTVVVSYRSLYMNQVPEKLYLGQWSYSKILSSQCKLMAQIELVLDKCFKYLSSNTTCFSSPKFSVVKLGNYLVALQMKIYPNSNVSFIFSYCFSSDSFKI